MRETVIVSTARTPIGKAYRGAFNNTDAPTLGGHAIKHAVLKAGVDPAIIVEVLSGGYAQTRVMDVRGSKIVQGDFEPGFKSRFHYKDLNIILQTGNDYQVPLPASALVHELYGAMMAADRGDLDHSGVITVLEDMAKVKARTKQ